MIHHLFCVFFPLQRKRTSETSLFVVIPVGSVLNRRPVNVSISYIPTENKRIQCQEDITIQKPDFLRLTSVPVTNTKSARDGYKKRTVSFSDFLDTPSGKHCVDMTHCTYNFVFEISRKLAEYHSM